jgi:hypothetical protein
MQSVHISIFNDIRSGKSAYARLVACIYGYDTKYIYNKNSEMLYKLFKHTYHSQYINDLYTISEGPLQML